MTSLSTAQRAVVEAEWNHGFSCGDIARHLGVCVDSVRHMMVRMRNDGYTLYDERDPRRIDIPQPRQAPNEWERATLPYDNEPERLIAVAVGGASEPRVAGVGLTWAAQRAQHMCEVEQQRALREEAKA